MSAVSDITEQNFKGQYDLMYLLVGVHLNYVNLTISRYTYVNKNFFLCNAMSFINDS